MLSDSVREREGAVADSDFSGCLGNVFAFCGFGGVGGGGGLSVLSDSVREGVGVVADGDFSTLCDSECLGALGGFGGTGGGVLTFGLCPACSAIMNNMQIKIIMLCIIPFAFPLASLSLCSSVGSSSKALISSDIPSRSLTAFLIFLIASVSCSGRYFSSCPLINNS